MKKKQAKKTTARISKHVSRHVKLALVPHRHNQYRPHLVRRYGLLAVIVLVLGLVAEHNLSVSGSVLGVRQPISTQDLLADTNTQRREQGLAPLHRNDELAKAAFLKANDMFRQQYWAHTAPDGTTPWHWFGQVDYSYAYAGENLAKNFASADATTAAWMASYEHRSNMLDPHYTEAGFAVMSGKLNGKQTSIVVALYAAPASPGVLAAQQTPVEEVSATNQPLNFVARFGVALQSLTPEMLGSFALLLVAAVTAVAAHVYRKKLPKPLRQSWYRHHGLYKAVGMTSLLVILVALYSGGQI